MLGPDEFAEPRLFELARERDDVLRIEACAAVSRGQPARSIDPSRPIENWRAETALFLLPRERPRPPAPEPTATGDLFG